MRVSLAANGRQMRTVLEAGAPDLIVLDLMMPGEDGLALCRELRASRFRTVPVLMLTALNEEADRILGLEMGADDYLPKPFNPRELVARIHAVLRRQSPSELPGAPSETTEVFEFGEFALNLATRTLTKAGQEIPLTTGEFSVLKVFARHPRQPLSREKLMELARGREYEVFDRSLDVQISRLRKLIEPCKLRGMGVFAYSMRVLVHVPLRLTADFPSTLAATATTMLSPSYASYVLVDCHDTGPVPEVEAGGLLDVLPVLPMLRR